MEFFSYYIYGCPCGDMFLGSYKGLLYACEWNTPKRRSELERKIQKHLGVPCQYHKSDVILETIKQLDEYFAKTRQSFDLPLAFIGTDFQKSVWTQLLTIPYGKTISYVELAEKIGNPNAVRAAANAARRNPISIIAPCHRVIGSNGMLTGYAGGLHVKRMLLDLEK